MEKCGKSDLPHYEKITDYRKISIYFYYCGK
ncbi:hypothetical protein EPIR_3792 [Erwinia piriflorinigrans CFBP 5888]|uniref:Uncharacterized protein n=1 Tax=Erwinia piriflorinigrans CFBP 5888 TaxID=1161919 RepID=V5ZCZ8_9GAMM|nr:hypothetical protein EPIR_3792 [Erwinia piriflorinigrans CFBP 5888]